MNSRLGYLALGLAFSALSTTALAQHAPKFPGGSLGFAQKPEKVQKPQVKQPVREVQDTRPKLKSIHKKAKSGSGKTVVRNGKPLVKMFPQPYEITFKFVTEWNKALAVYPAFDYEFCMMEDDKPVVLQSGKMTIDASGQGVVKCTLPDPTENAFITFHMTDKSNTNPEWSFASADKVAYVMPKTFTTGKRKPPVFKKEAPPIQLKRNLVDMAIRGLPKNATAKVGEKSLDLTMSEDGLAHFTIARETAETDSFQVVIHYEDELISRQAVVDAGLQLIKNGGRVSPYTSNTFNIPDEDWVTQRVEFTDVPIQKAVASMGVVDEVGLYSEQELATILGQPEQREASKAFSRTDGSEWLHYPSKGISIRARTMGGIGNAKDRCIELFKITSPAGGKIGGVGVGDEESLLIARYGAGMTSQNLGGPSVGFRSYFAEGLVFNLDPDSRKVTSIDVWRPMSLISKALEPQRMDLPNRLYIEPQNVQGADSVTGGLGSDLSNALAPLHEWLTLRLGSSKSIRRAPSASAADLILSWDVKKIHGESGTGVVRGSLGLDLKMKMKNGNPVTESLDTGSVSYSGLVGNSSEELARKLFEKIINPVCETVSKQFLFLNPVRAINYTTSEIELDFGKVDCDLSEGVVFELMNLNSPAFPSKLDRKELKTDLGKKEMDSKVGIRIVLVTQTVSSKSATAKLAALVRQRGKAGQGFVDRIVLLDPQDSEGLIRRLIDPKTGLLFVRLKPVFELEQEPVTP